MRFHHPIIDGFMPYKPPPWKPPPCNILNYHYSTLLLTFAIFRTITNTTTYKTIFNLDVYPLRIFLSDKHFYTIHLTTIHLTTTPLPSNYTTLIFRHPFISGFMLMIFTTTSLPTISTTIIFRHPLIDGFMPTIFSHPFIDSFMPSKQLPRSPLYRFTTTNMWGDMISPLYESDITNITNTNTTTTTATTTTTPTTTSTQYITTNTIPDAVCVISNNTNTTTQYFSTTNNNNNINNCSTSPNLGDLTAHQTECKYDSGHISQQRTTTPFSLQPNMSLHLSPNNNFESTTQSQHE